MLKKIILSLVVTSIVIQAYTLEDSVKKVLTTNPVILERLANYRETSKDLSIAKAEHYPTLDLVSSIGNEKTDNNNRTILANDQSLAYYENSLTLMLNIFNGFGTMNKASYQKSRILAAAYNFVEKANDNSYQVTKHYINVIKQRELLEIAKENVSVHNEIFKKVNELYKTGIAAKSEVRKINASLSLARSNLIVQENNTMDAAFSYKKVLGERVDIDSLVIPKFTVKLPSTLNEASAYAIRNNPSLIVSKYNIEASQYLKKHREKDLYPKVDLIVQQNLDKNTYGIEAHRNRFRAGVIMTYNLYRGGADMDNIQKSMSAVHRDVQTKNELQRQTIEGLELSWAAYIVLEKQLVELKKYKEYSVETIELYNVEYDLGRRTLLDLLSAQADFNNATMQTVTAKYDRLFAKYRILDSMGLLVAGVMGNDYDYLEEVGLTGINAVDNEDSLVINYDEDKDNIAISDDICQASDTGDNILQNGCLKLSNRFSSVKYFDMLNFSNDEIVDSSKNTIVTIVNIAKDNQDKLGRIILQSYSSTGEDMETDIIMSNNYGQMVKSYLTEAGIDAKTITISANGSSSPYSSDESLNNRVNVIMYLK